ncbi:MAG: AI-2E family transporter [Bacillota bacterium]|nr:AI-2E family transporter [Bacillota bacterium]
MEKAKLKSYILIITYAVLLIALMLRLEMVLSAIGLLIKILSPLFVGIGIALILNRPFHFYKRVLTKYLKKEKAAKPIALLLAYISMIAVLAAVFSIILPRLTESIQLLINSVTAYTPQIEGLLRKAANALNVTTPDFSGLVNSFKTYAGSAASMLSDFFPRIFSFTSSVISVVSNISFGLVISIYLLIAQSKLKNQIHLLLYAYLPEKRAGKIDRFILITAETFSKFVSGQLTEACILGFMCFIGMIIFRFNYALLISVLLAVTAIIPIVGGITGCVISVFILLMVNPIKAIWFIVFFIVLQQIEGNLVYPRVVGGSIGLPALWVLLSIIIGGGLFGVVGMLISVPITSVFYQILKKDILARTQ